MSLSENYKKVSPLNMLNFISTEKKNFDTNISMVAGAVAGSTAKTFTAPLSRLTILYQLDHGSSRHFTMRETLRNSLKEEGFCSLWKGNLASVIHKVPYSGTNYFVYEKAKIALSPYWNSPTDPGALCRFTAGVCGGGAAVLSSYPLDVARTRLAASKSRGKSPGIFNTIWTILTREGPSALYNGVGVSVLCQGLNIGLNFLIYETLQVRAIQLEHDLMKRLETIDYISNNYIFHQYRKGLIESSSQRSSLFSSFWCGAIAGSTASLIIFPLDLVRRRLQMPDNLETKGSRLLNILKRIWMSDGYRGFYRGLLPELVKVAPAVTINFYIYELVRQRVFGASIAPR